ncbi:hypothetical protein FA13DRAFT_1628923 [Coprinellus micaceus]|uniref:Uncharacterized protein n=1 Tax=Coprinellus micaceus TaxID=71717 RepID=A0A4Y7TCP3_COPMI|nr:hypothetical protein FA13DRAFT_1628923 [Coprinellus micaceus]
MQYRALAATLLASATLAAAQFKVNVPSANDWWVAKSQNVLTWACQDSAAPQEFTVLIGNSDPTVLVQPLAIIAIQKNYDCSIIITQDQANQAAGTGYQVYLANPINNTDVYAVSESFEIKPLGSLYPTQQAAQASSASAAAASASASASAAATTDDKNGAVSVKAAGLVAGAVGVVAGLAAML